MACQFTPGELAGLSVIAAEVRRNGKCEWHADKIAAHAGICRRTVQRAVAHAVEMGFLHREERFSRPSRETPINDVGR